jgi:hypothetical protein
MARGWPYPSPGLTARFTQVEACERATGDTGAIKINTDVVETYEEPWRVRGTDETADSTAVTLRLSYNNPLTGKPAEEHATLHAVPVDGEWRWTGFSPGLGGSRPVGLLLIPTQVRILPGP